MEKKVARDMIFCFFWECTKEKLCTIPIDTADQIIDAWFEDYWGSINQRKAVNTENTELY